MSSTLQLRQSVRQAIMSGQLVSATVLLQQQCPAVLAGHNCSTEVQFYLSCQQYIELIRLVQLQSSYVNVLQCCRNIAIRASFQTGAEQPTACGDV